MAGDIVNPEELKRILLIEDDQKLGQKIKRFLQQNEFEVDWHTGGSLLGVDAGINAYDLILCDVNLPDTCGFEICKTWRQRFRGRFIFITAFNDDDSQLQGFDLGADDYIVKPVQPQLLLARIRANLRRHTPPTLPSDEETSEQCDDIRIPNLRLILRQHQVQVFDESLNLTQQEFEIFYLLARNFNDKVSREAMFKIALGKEYDGFDRTVDVYVSKLRKKFNHIQGNPYQIKTLWGKGYILTQQAGSGGQ